MLHICNAFSINMLAGDTFAAFTKVTPEYAARMVADEGYVSHVGHEDMAKVMGTILGIELPMNRDTFIKGDEDLLVGQYRGPRLPEGTVELPEGATIEWWVVSTQPKD